MDTANNKNNHNDVEFEDGTQNNANGGESYIGEFRRQREDMSANQLEFVDPRSTRLEETLTNINNIFQKVRKTSDALAGNQTVLQVAILAKERIKNVHCEFRSFKNYDFMDKLRTMMNISNRAKRDNEENGDDDSEEEDRFDDYVFTKANIIHFGREVMPFFRLLPRPTFMIGSLDKEVQVVKRQRKPREKVETLESQRTNIKELQKDALSIDDNKTVGEVERIFSILRKYFKKTKGTPIGLFEFIINPNSFSRTIENIFYLSFLVKDGYAKVYLNEDNLPVIEPILDNERATNEAQQQKNNITNIQSVISLTKLEWKELIEVFEIERPLIPEPNEQTTATQSTNKH